MIESRATRASEPVPKQTPFLSPALGKVTVHVCISCRQRGTPRDPLESRPGHILYQQLRKAFNGSALKERVDVRQAECLSICPRPCGIAISLPGAWTYLFGDQKPSEAMGDVIECVSLYLQSSDGFLARNSRPKSMRRSILGRVPPAPRGL
jgi:predicted metal-binding protein